MHRLKTDVGQDQDQEYRAIEAALLENPRGRWFLAEHGRRSRRLDSVLLEQSMYRLQSALRQPPAVLARLSAEVEQLTAELTAIRTKLLERQSGAVQDGSLRPVQLMLQAAEELHELMWQLQGHDVDAVTCERIGRQAMMIHALGAAQAAESERTLTLAAGLDQLTQRLDGLLTMLLEEGRGDPDDEPSDLDHDAPAPMPAPAAAPLPPSTNVPRPASIAETSPRGSATLAADDQRALHRALVDD